MTTLAKGRRTPRPLNDERLRELALRYVGRFATTQAKLRAYLSRKIRERGWEGAREPDIEGIARRFAELAYIDDAAYAMSKARSLSGRGYGKRRVADKLRADGVGEADGAAAIDHANAEAVSAVLLLAERRRVGPFAAEPADPRQREKWIAALVRAGHDFGLSRAIATMPPGAEINRDELLAHHPGSG